MRHLAIVRHGEAAPGAPDAERTLTSRGHDEASGAAAWIGERPELAGARVWASPLHRAQQTAGVIAAALGVTVETVAGLTPEDDPQTLVERFLIDEPAQPVILISHMPFVGELTGRLVEGRSSGIAFPTAGVALLDADVWAAGCATLNAFVGPPYDPASRHDASP
ncbi:phosphohistidine phosphatase SixA [Salinicola halophilus]|uniref:phosphohistidine phosphatase SixA n=1 Tax=Salinicola halophilus TaxID=184065 RepID=UPI000DA17760|nr:phosphohistidine phosphatase SixA [Salinicola halophilus]